jgi:hypothetical protein
VRRVVFPLLIDGASVSQPLQWKLFIRKRASATQGVPPGKDDLKWVANTTTVIHGEQKALLVDTFLSDAQTAELADWLIHDLHHSCASRSFFRTEAIERSFSSGSGGSIAAGGGEHAESTCTRCR